MAEIFLKLAGGALVMAATVAYGESRARFLEMRVKQLQQFQRSLKLLAAEITCARSLLPDAFQAVGRQSQGPVREIYLAASHLLYGGGELSAGEAWHEAVERVYPRSCFTPGDREIIESLGLSLGLSQQGEQLKQVQLIARQVELALEEAWEDRRRRAKLWRYLGFTGGAALVILLL